MKHLTIINIILLAINLLSINIQLNGDDHFIQEETRTYHGYTSPVNKKETWFSEHKLCLTGSRVTLILRLDLNKKWLIYREINAYVEKTISPETDEHNKSIHEVGWDYIPQYDWVLEKTTEKKQINGLECQKYIAKGEADYAEQTIELFLSNTSPINIKWYHRFMKVLDDDWASLLSSKPELTDYFVVQSNYTRINPISPPIFLKVECTKIESAEPPPHIYELPEGFEKVDSMEEIYRRLK